MTKSNRSKMELEDGKYIYFQLASKQNPKTWIMNVWTQETDILLGQIRWYAPWRQYSFYPEEGTLYEINCMKDITEAIRIMNTRQRDGIKPVNPQTKLVVEV